MDYTNLNVSLDGDVAILTLNDPASLNAASMELTRSLTRAVQAVARGDIAARAVVLTGAGRGFCSGANLNGIGAGNLDAEGQIDLGRTLKELYEPLVNTMRDLPVPILAAVNGPAVGIGCAFALMCDLIFGGESAYFQLSFNRIGLVPDGGSTFLVPRLVGRARAMEMALLGERIPAPKALDWGLINRCVPDAELVAATLATARQLAAGPMSIGLIRKVMWSSLDAQWAEQLEAERTTQALAGRSADFTEGVAAFREKRPAQFTGR